MVREFNGKRFYCAKPGTWISIDRTVGIYRMCAGLACEQWEVYVVPEPCADPLMNRENDLAGVGLTMTEAVRDWAEGGA